MNVEIAILKFKFHSIDFFHRCESTFGQVFHSETVGHCETRST